MDGRCGVDQSWVGNMVFIVASGSIGSILNDNT